MDNLTWDILQEYRKRKGIPIHVAAHWVLTDGCSREELTRRLDEAIELHDTWQMSKVPDFCSIGVNIILDGLDNLILFSLLQKSFQRGKVRVVFITWLDQKGK